MNRPATRLAVLALGCTVLTACSSSDSPEAASGAGAITVENCGEKVSVDAPVTELYAYDGGIISIALAVGARDELVAVTGMARDQDVLELAYPDAGWTSSRWSATSSPRWRTCSRSIPR